MLPTYLSLLVERNFVFDQAVAQETGNSGARGNHWHALNMKRKFDCPSWLPWRRLWRGLLHVVLVTTRTDVPATHSRADAFPEIDTDHWSDMEINLRTWLRFCSWGRCANCGALYTRNMTQAEILRPDVCCNGRDGSHRDAESQ